MMLCSQIAESIRRIKVFRVFPLIVFAAMTAYGQLAVQDVAPEGGGSAPMPTDQITDEQRDMMWKEIRANVARLTREGRLAPAVPQVVLFDWPLMKAPGIPDFNIEGISNYVDQNLSFPNQLLDYNCGARTYDQSNGYNHKGIDFFTWPFGWEKMDNSKVYVVAAAPGTIVAKFDGNFDRSCGFGGGNWNAVYVQHADGSIAWYGHMKNGSPTSKAVGEAVVAGEILGIVGSSGNSTGPHLHFEIYDAANQLKEPYQGTCNAMNSVTWWANQEPYRNSRMNRLMTHSAGPVFPACPTQEVTNEKNVFRQGETFTTAGYFRDALQDQQTQYSLIRPNGTVNNSWNHNSPQTYSASYWFWNWASSTASMKGRWTLRAIFNGQEYNHSFNITERAKFDFDGDNRSDLSVFRPSNNTWYTLRSSGGTVTQSWGLAGDKIVPADFDGDGRADIAVWRPSDGKWYIINSSNNSVRVIEWGLLNDIPVPADFNADNRADLTVYRPSEGKWYLLDFDGRMYAQSWGIPGDRPVPADYDADGKADIAVFRPSEGKWYIARSGDGIATIASWGLDGDVAIPADYDGDAKADIVVFRSSNNSWYLYLSGDNSARVIQWGLNGDIPLSADFNGDGKYDIAVFRPSNGTWYALSVTTGVIITQQWGITGDVPAPKAFLN